MLYEDVVLNEFDRDFLRDKILDEARKKSSKELKNGIVDYMKKRVDIEDEESLIHDPEFLKELIKDPGFFYFNFVID